MALEQLLSLSLAMCQVLEQGVDGAANRVVHDPEIHPEAENSNDDYEGRCLHVFVRRRGDLLHLRADVVVKGLDPLWPRLQLAADSFFAHDCCHRLRHSLYLNSQICSSKTLAGAEGFEPPSSVLETDSLTVELTPLNSLSNFVIG